MLVQQKRHKRDTATVAELKKKKTADFFKFGSLAPGGITMIELFFSFITLALVF